MKWYARLLVFLGVIIGTVLPSSTWFPIITRFIMGSANDHQPNGLVLQVPSFFKIVHAQDNIDFISSEAGMSAYINIEKPIDFVALKKGFKSNMAIEEETHEYIIGVIKPPGYEKLTELKEYMDVHFYIHQSGWIIAYLSKRTPASQMIDFVNYETQELSSSTLANVVIKLASIAGVSKTQPNYYHFVYPEATNLQLIADLQREEGQDTFSVEIPSSITVFEKSYIHAAYNYASSIVELDGDEELDDWNFYQQWNFRSLAFDDEQFEADVNHIFRIHHNPYSGDSSSLVGLAIIYRRDE